MSSNKLMCSHKLGINSLKLHRHSFMGAAMLPSWIQWLRWTSPLCLIIFYAWGSRPSPIRSMPKVEERKTCRRLCAVEVIFNLCLYLQTERYEGSYLCLNNWERVLFTRETKTAKDKMPSSPPSPQASSPEPKSDLFIHISVSWSYNARSTSKKVPVTQANSS